MIDEFKQEEDQVLVNGRRAAVLKIRKAKVQDSLRVAAEVKRLLAEERQANSAIDLTVINDMSVLVDDRISLLIKNGGQGCILVFAVM